MHIYIYIYICIRGPRGSARRGSEALFASARGSPRRRRRRRRPRPNNEARPVAPGLARRDRTSCAILLCCLSLSLSLSLYTYIYIYIHIHVTMFIHNTQCAVETQVVDLTRHIHASGTRAHADGRADAWTLAVGPAGAPGTLLGRCRAGRLRGTPASAPLDGAATRALRRGTGRAASMSCGPHAQSTG